MQFKYYLYGALIYVVLAIVLGMVVSMLAPYAVLIGALIGGIYVGMKGMTPMRAAIDGIIACVIGGVIAALVATVISIPATTGVSFLDSIIVVFGGMIAANSSGAIVGTFAWFIATGIILGAIGGFIGKKLKK